MLGVAFEQPAIDVNPAVKPNVNRETSIQADRGDRKRNPIFAQALAPKAVSMPKAAEILPAETIAVGFLNFDAEAWANLKLFNPFSENPLGILDQILALPKGKTFVKDIQPWISDRIAIALPLHR